MLSDFDNIKKELKEIIKNKNGNKLHFEMAELFIDCIETSISKNKDYASDDDPYKNFRFAEIVNLCPIEIAIQVRRCDKFARECNLLFNNNEVKDESIFDTLLDDIVYTAILYTYLKDKYDEIEKNINKIKDIIKNIVSYDYYKNRIDGYDVIYDKETKKYEILILYKKNPITDIEKEIYNKCNKIGLNVYIINHTSGESI